MGKKRGGARQAKNPAPVPAPGPGAGKGMNRTDGGPGSAEIPLKQPIRRLPNADYGANKKFVGGQEVVNGLPREGTIDTTPLSTNNPGIEVFGPTEFKNQPATSGGITGPGVGTEAIAEGAEDIDILLNELNARNPNNLYIKQLINTRNKEIQTGFFN